MIHSNVVSRPSGIKAFVIAASMITLFGMSATAGADEQKPVTKSKHVGLADLDLSTTQGQAIAYERLHQSARNLCSQVADELDLSHQANFVACVDNAMANVGAKLQALANRKAGTSVAQNQAK